MTYSIKKLTLGAIIAIALSLVIFSDVRQTSAKGIFGLGKKTATATSTLAFLTPGTGTTTLAYDTYTDGLSTADSMALLVRLTASSSPNTVLNIKQEFSQDGIDWYQNSQPTIIQNATTTSAVDLSMVPLYSWRFASSSIGGVIGASNSDTRIIPVKSPTRFTRFIFTMAAGGANGSIWANILPVKQNP